MLLTGAYQRTLDDKLRVALPKRLRDALKSSNLYLAPGTDGSLGIYPENVFEHLADRLNAASPVGDDVRTFSRLFFAQAHAVEVDAQGRIRLPQELAELAGLQKEVVLLGVRDHLELWDRFGWEGYRNDRQRQYDQIAERALDPRAGSARPGQHPDAPLTNSEPDGIAPGSGQIDQRADHQTGVPRSPR